MADLKWTPDEHRWLARRNRTALASSEAGRKELERFEDAPILMTTRQVNKQGEDSADQFNARRLEALSGLAAMQEKPHGAIVLVTRGLPRGAGGDDTSASHDDATWGFQGSLFHKVMVAKGLGAAGVLVAQHPDNPAPPIPFDAGSGAVAGIPCAMVSAATRNCVPRRAASSAFGSAWSPPYFAPPEISAYRSPSA